MWRAARVMSTHGTFSACKLLHLSLTALELNGATQQIFCQLTWRDSVPGTTFPSMTDAEASQDLRRKAEALLSSVLPTPSSGLEESSPSVLILGTDDFVTISHSLAIAAGIDVADFGQRLNPSRPSPYAFGLAIRILAEIEGYYVEVPNAYTLHRVPRDFLVTVAAVAIGIATGKAGDLGALLGGAVGGLGSLLINILSSRATTPQSDLKWFEEMLVAVLREAGPSDLTSLKKKTGLNRAFIQLAVDGLVSKGLVTRAPRKPKSKTYVYTLKN